MLLLDVLNEPNQASSPSTTNPENKVGVLIRIGILLLIATSCTDDEIPMLDITPSEPILVAESQYTLPYSVGMSYGVIQGNNSNGTHQGSFRFSYDFGMPIGDTIVAARAGVVVFVQEDFLDSDPLRGNKIVVQHADGSLARYVHLTNQGALKTAGDSVLRGEAIALSGDSGLGNAHLHFDVINVPQPGCGPTFCGSESCTTRFTVFANASGSLNQELQEAMGYLALPFVQD